MKTKRLRVLTWVLLVVFAVLYSGFSENTLQLCEKLRACMAAVTSIFPYSLFEVFILLIPIVLIFFFKHAGTRFIRKSTVVIVSFLLTVYFVNIVIPYYCVSPQKEQEKCSEDQYLHAVYTLSSEISSLNPTNFSQKSTAPYGAKVSILSGIYTALGISGLYYFPTAEYVVNMDTPAYISAFCAAHEYSHFSSVMREDEANLNAYILLASSEEPFFRYSAYLYAFELISSSLLASDYVSVDELLSLLPDFARSDLLDHKQYVQSYKNGFFYKISLKLNDAAQSVNDKRGGASYSSSASLICNYILFG